MIGRLCCSFLARLCCRFLETPRRHLACALCHYSILSDLSWLLQFCNIIYMCIVRTKRKTFYWYSIHRFPEQSSSNSKGQSPCYYTRHMWSADIININIANAWGDKRQSSMACCHNILCQVFKGMKHYLVGRDGLTYSTINIICSIISH